MNDLTKDELIMLKRLILLHVNQFRGNSGFIEVADKIQSMIDNYCERKEQLEKIVDEMFSE